MFNFSSGSGSSFPLTSSKQAQLNLNPALQLAKWRAAVGNVRASTGNAKILCVGDSITLGAYSNNSLTGDWQQKSFTNILAKMFNSSGTPAFCDSSFGYNYVANDGRAVLTAPWVIDPGLSIGGKFLASTNAGVTNGFAFTPINQVDTFKFWTIKIAGAGVLGYDINGLGAGTIDLNAATALTSVTTTAALAVNTLNFHRVSGGNTFLVGVEAYNSTAKAVQIIQAGWSGATTTNWVDISSVYAPGHFESIGADLTIIMLGINDLLPSNAIPSSTTTLNIQTLITSALTTGDVILCTEPPAVVVSTISLAAQAVYWNAIKALADTNNIAVVDVNGRWVSYEYSNPLGYYYGGAYAGNLHPVGLGYADIAKAIYKVIGDL